MSDLPYAMFDLAASASDARRLDRMENIYHRGQALVWNGRTVLADLVKKHGGTHIAPEKRDAARELLSTLMWGELAAWRVSAQLADRIEPLGAKMAATSQAHDEARHFYVLHDYLELATGGASPRPYRASEKLLRIVLETNDLPSKLLGMQLQVETAALTIFQQLRELNLCPVLTELLPYYEKDEARHVGLGMQYLPMLVHAMSRTESARFTASAVRITYWLLRSTMAMAPNMRTLGIDPNKVTRLGKSKQLIVFEELWSTAPETKTFAGQVFTNGMQAIAAGLWPPDDQTSLVARARAAGHAMLFGLDGVQTSIEPDVDPTSRVN